MKRRLKQKRKGTLHIVGALLVASATLRMGAGTGEAVAQSLTQSPEQQPVPVSDVPVSNAEKDATLRALMAREAALEEREAALENRLAAMALAESELEEQLFALQQAEQSLRETIALADGAAEMDLARLTTVYENMKPKEAAALFEEMPPNFAAGFLGLMRPDAAAQIMTLLTPQTAYSISVVLAGRNANVPTE